MGGRAWSWAPRRPFVHSSIHLRGGPVREAGHPRACQQGVSSYLFSTLMSEASAHGRSPSKLAQAGWQATGCRAGDLVALWSPQLAHPLVRPPSHQAPAEGKEGFLQPTSIQKLPTATSRNAFDHLNPGCINSPNPLNSQGFSLMPNGRPFPSFLEHPGATQGPGHG